MSQLSFPGMYIERWIHDEDGYVYGSLQTVREEHQGHVVHMIEYRAYQQLAEALMHIGDEVGDSQRRDVPIIYKIISDALADYTPKSKGDE
jgi:hypothetical protein